MVTYLRNNININDMDDCISIIVSYTRCLKCKYISTNNSQLCFIHYMIEKYPQIFSHYRQYIHGVRVGSDPTTLENKMIKYKTEYLEKEYRDLMWKCFERVL